MTLASPIPLRAPRRLQALALVGLSLAAVAALAGAAPAQEPTHSAELDAAIVRAARRHGVPEHLVRRIVMRESRYNPRARNHSFWGLMQISYPTARSMGFKGTPEQLLNPVTNLAYAVPYLANAFIAAGRQEDAAVRLYASGYYSTARSRGILGLLRTAESKPMNGVPDEPTLASTPPAAVADSGWSLFGSSAPAAAPAEAPAQQQLAYAAPESAAAAPAQAQIQAIAHAAPTRAETRGTAKTAEKNADDGVAMVAGRDGAMAPPRRWQHDGGTSVIGRGEQGVEHVAAYRLADGAAGRARHSRKTTVFASLEAEGAAPATAAPAPQPTAFYATAAAPAAGDAPADPQQAAAQLAANEAVGGAAAADEATDKPKHRRRHHHKGDE